MAREATLTDTFVELADSLVTDFDVADFLTMLTGRAVELLWVSAAGVLLTGPDDSLRVMASSSEQSHLTELFELQADQGPCLDCYRTGEIVTSTRLSNEDRWPRFAPKAREMGFESVAAVPLRYRTRVIGALNLFGADVADAPEGDLRLAQAIADVATISILQQQATAESDRLSAQLSAALQSRVVIEQAKGVLAEAGDIAMDVAFNALRSHSRNTNQRLSAVAAAVVDRSLPTDTVLRIAAR